MATNSNKKENIQVFLRVRPLNSPEKKQKSPSVINVVNNRDVHVKDVLGNLSKTFTFDKVFGPHSKQIELYKEVVQQLIPEVLAGYNCTVFAYGQTGSGKTFTMEGERSENDDLSWERDPLCGIIPRCFSQLFDDLYIAQMDHTVRVSFLEIYNEELIDLLSLPNDNTKLKLFDDTAKKGSVIVNGLEEKTVKSKDEIYDILEKGAAKRQTASTLMNAHSSRSHTIFSITVHVREMVGEEEFFKTGKLNLVDLAGSENIGRSGAVDKRAREAGNINQSLLTLGRVITALVEHRPHVPYRESKLTRMLQDSLGGRTKTSIIATVSPAAINFEESLSTLNYASRAKNIVNKPEINQKLTQKIILKEYMDELDRLRRDLKACRNKEGIYVAEENYNEMMLKIKNNDQEVSDKINWIRVLEGEKDKLQEIIRELQEKAREHEAKLTETVEKLDEEKYIVEQMTKTENLLLIQAKEVENVADQAITHVNLLHEKINRKDAIDEHNRNLIVDICEQTVLFMENISRQFEIFLGGQISFQIEWREKIGENFSKTDNFVNVVNVGVQNVSNISVENHSDRLIKCLQETKNNLIQSFDQILSFIKNDVNTRQIMFDNFFDTAMFRMNNIVTSVRTIEEIVIQNKTIGNEYIDAFKLLNDASKEIFINLKKLNDVVTELFTQLYNDCIESLVFNNEVLSQQIAVKTISEELNEKNNLLLDKMKSGKDSFEYSWTKQVSDLADSVKTHNSELKNCVDNFSCQCQEKREENLSAKNVFETAIDDMNSVFSWSGSNLAEMATHIKENFAQSRLETNSSSHSSLTSYSYEQLPNEISCGIRSIYEKYEESDEVLLDSLAASNQKCLEKSVNFSKHLNENLTETSNLLSEFTNSYLLEKHILDDIPTGNTPLHGENKEMDFALPSCSCFSEIIRKNKVASTQEIHINEESRKILKPAQTTPHSTQPPIKENAQPGGKENEKILKRSDSSRKKKSSGLKSPNPVSHVKKVLSEKN